MIREVGGQFIGPDSQPYALGQPAFVASHPDLFTSIVQAAV
jgi:hypothetical protein